MLDVADMAEAKGAKGSIEKARGLSQATSRIISRHGNGKFFSGIRSRRLWRIEVPIGFVAYVSSHAQPVRCGR